MDPAIEKAYEIAAESLRQCYSDFGILAGKRHFDDYWARDCFFGCLGALKLKDYYIVKKSFELFLKYQKDDGQLPMRIGQYDVNFKFIGIRIRAEILPRYGDDKNNSKTTDPNSLFIISLHEYLKKTQDYPFFEENYKKIKAAIDWNFSQDSDNDLLIEEKPYANWMDSIKKQGKVLYTNICHWKAVESFSKMAHKEDAEKYSIMSGKIKDRINELFWNGNYFVDWVKENVKYDYFSSDGNLLAVYFGFVTRMQKKKILAGLNKFKENSILIETSYPFYSKKFVSLRLKLVGMGDYHNGLYWLWLSCLASCIENKKTRADILNKIASILVKEGVVVEVYDRKLRPLKRLLYQGEKPFALNSTWCIISKNIK